MRREKGFTLIEIVVVLAIIAVIAAFLTPMLFDYLKTSKVARANADVREIAASIGNFSRDTGVWPVYTDAPLTKKTATLQILATDGQNPDLTGTTIAWSITTNNAALKSILHDGNIGTGTNSYSANLGKPNDWKGPYMTDFKADPWGNKYFAVVDGLQPGSSNVAYVISAGSNGQLETIQYQAATGANFVGGDDIFCRIK